MAVAADRTHPQAARAGKMLASTGFVVVAVVAGASGSPFGRAVLVALVSSWVGDLALTFRTERAFIVGLVAFAWAHVAYTVAFVLRGVAAGPTVVAAVGLAVIGRFVWRWLSDGVPPDLRRPVVGYIVVIGTMVATAYGTFASAGDPRIVAGATAFFVSDLAVAKERFVASPAPRRGVPDRLWGLPLYFAGQVLLALAGGG